MSLGVDDLNTLSTYVNGVIDRADHHASRVNAVVLALLGAVIWRKADGVSIEILKRGSTVGNVLWVEMAGSRYAFSYDHEREKIDLRKGSLQGETLSVFDNDSKLTDIYNAFKSL
jgi:hypothetical protein